MCNLDQTVRLDRVLGSIAAHLLVNLKFVIITFQNKMAWKILVSMVTMCVVVQMAQCKPVEKRGPAPIDPVEGGSKAEEDVVRFIFLQFFFFFHLSN